MNLSKEQKLIVAMLADLGRAPEKRELNFELISKAVAYGQSWAIDWQYGALFGEEVDYVDVKFVSDVLDMWNFVESAYDRLTQSEKVELEDMADFYGRDPSFVGFDGNNESHLMGIAHFMVEDLDRFGRFKGREFNSHMPKRDRYALMLERWRPIRHELAGRNLGLEDLVTVLRA